MRALFLISLSAAVLSGCLTTQENPNYEHSTVYKGDSTSVPQYAAATPAQLPASQSITYSQNVPSADMTTASHDSASYPVFAHPAPAQSPTDAAYGETNVTGTPGFMAMQNEQQAVALTAAAPTMPQAQYVTTAPLGAAGTPVDYDYSRNLITVDAATTSQQNSETVRVMQGAGINYIVQPGDTVYSLSRKTCVGVNVIQSMNGLNAEYAINIGQSLTLPAGVC